jgi:hypothetical protein
MQVAEQTVMLLMLLMLSVVVCLATCKPLEVLIPHGMPIRVTRIVFEPGLLNKPGFVMMALSIIEFVHQDAIHAFYPSARPAGATLAHTQNVNVTCTLLCMSDVCRRV